MRTHNEIVKAIKRASMDGGFAILEHRRIAERSPQHDEIRIVRKDRQHLLPRRDTTLVLRYPDVLVTDIDLHESADLTIAYHIPYPAYLDLDSAVVAARAVREYLIEALALDPPPRWKDARDADEDDLASLFDSIFSVSCTVFESGGGQQGVEIRLEHIWVFEHDEPTNEAEIEGESESILAAVDHVWHILLPEAHRDDLLAPLSFLLPAADEAE